MDVIHPKFQTLQKCMKKYPCSYRQILLSILDVNISFFAESARNRLLYPNATTIVLCNLSTKSPHKDEINIIIEKVIFNLQRPKFSWVN